MVSVILHGPSDERMARTLDALAAAAGTLRRVGAQVLAPEQCVEGRRIPAPLQDLVEPTGRGQFTLATAVAASRGPLLVLFEGGTLPTQESIERHVASHSAAGAAFVTGPVELAGRRREVPFDHTSVHREALTRIGVPDELLAAASEASWVAYERRIRDSGLRLVRLEGVLRRLTFGEAGGTRRLTTLGIWLSDRCNLRCASCGNAYLARRREPSLDETRSLLDEAGAAGIEKIELASGEPTLSPHFAAILDHATSLGLEVGFVTNGTILDDRLAAVMARSRVGDVPVSIEGPPAAHDRIRGPGTFARALRGIEVLQRHRVPFSIFCTVSRRNLAQLADLVRLASEWGAARISFQPFSPAQAGRNPGAAALALRPEDDSALRRAIDDAFEASARSGVTIRSPALLRLIPEYVQGGGTLVPRSGCTVPSRFAYVDRNRALMTCYVPYAAGRYARYRPGALLATWRSATHEALVREAEAGRCSGCLANCSDLETLDGAGAKWRREGRGC